MMMTTTIATTMTMMLQYELRRWAYLLMQECLFSCTHCDAPISWLTPTRWRLWTTHLRYRLHSCNFENQNIFEISLSQILMNEDGSLRLKFYEYITDLWNIMDVVTMLMYIAGLILRFIPPEICERCFYSARIILALNLMGFFFRILHMFSVHKELGPKLVMIGHMVSGCHENFWFPV